MTWTQIVKAEPRLKALYDEARAVRDDKTREWFCANHVWYEDFKPRLVKLVGWECRNSLIRDDKSYDTAYQRIYRALPDCRGCQCM